MSLTAAEQATIAQALKDVEGYLRTILGAHRYGEIHIEVKPDRVTVAGKNSCQYEMAARR